MTRSICMVVTSLALAACGGDVGEQQTEVASPGTGLTPIVAGPLRIEPGGIDFGPLPAQTRHEARVMLRNVGQTPITIVQTKRTCLCATPQNLAGTVIAPGQSIPFVSGFETQSKPGEKSTKVMVIFDVGGNHQQVAVPLRADVVMPVRADPPYVDALNGVTRGTVSVRSADGRSFRIVSTDGRPPVHGDGYDPAKDEPRNAYTLAWTVPARDIDHCAGARMWWVIETDHPDCPVLPMRVRHECTGGRSDPNRLRRGWTFKEPIENLGGIRGGEPVDVEVELFNRNAITITGVESLTNDARAELVSQAPSGEITKCLVRFTPREGYEGMLYAMVNFRSPAGDKEVAFVARVF